MKILVVGGSNSRMVAGYTKYFLEAMQVLGGNVEKFDNFSIGANTCLLGLITMGEVEGDDYDLILIEYSVNDYAMFESGDEDLWRASYEGLLRMALSRWPNSLICCVILGRSNVKPQLWDEQIKKTHAIVRNYKSVLIADAQEYLNASRGAGESLYSDPMHYSEEAQKVAGGFVANKVLAAKDGARGVLPPSLCPDALFPIGVFDFSLVSQEALTSVRTFSNSAVKVKSLAIGLGDRVDIEIFGSPVCIVFVSEKGVGSFRMTCEGKSAVVHTLHDGVRDGKFLFLPLSAYGSWWKDGVGAKRMSFEAIPRHAGPADWRTYHVGPSDAKSPMVYLCKLLYRI